MMVTTTPQPPTEHATVLLITNVSHNRYWIQWETQTQIHVRWWPVYRLTSTHISQYSNTFISFIYECFVITLYQYRIVNARRLNTPFSSYVIIIINDDDNKTTIVSVLCEPTDLLHAWLHAKHIRIGISHYESVTNMILKAADIQATVTDDAGIDDTSNWYWDNGINKLFCLCFSGKWLILRCFCVVVLIIS